MAGKSSDNSPIGVIAFIFLLANIYFSFKGSKLIFDLNFWQAGLMSVFINAIIILLNVYLQQGNLLKAITLLAFIIACWYDLKIVVVGIEDMLKIKAAGSPISNIIEANSWTGILLSIIVLSMTIAFSFVTFENREAE